MVSTAKLLHSGYSRNSVAVTDDEGNCCSYTTSMLYCHVSAWSKAGGHKNQLAIKPVRACLTSATDSDTRRRAYRSVDKSDLIVDLVE